MADGPGDVVFTAAAAVLGVGICFPAYVSFREFFGGMTVPVVAVFFIGVAYGLVVARLHPEELDGED